MLGNYIAVLALSIAQSLAHLLTNTLTHAGIFKDITSNSFDANYLFRQNSVILSWNDSRKGCDSDLKAEEAIFKQYQHDMKKYQKKSSNSKGPKKVHNVSH